MRLEKDGRAVFQHQTSNFKDFEETKELSPEGQTEEKKEQATEEDLQDHDDIH